MNIDHLLPNLQDGFLRSEENVVSTILLIYFYDIITSVID